MRYAGAIRLDHVFGAETPLPYSERIASRAGQLCSTSIQSLLAVVLQESVQNFCIVISEDLKWSQQISAKRSPISIRRTGHAV